MKIIKWLISSVLLLSFITGYGQVTVKKNKFIITTKSSLTTTIDSLSYILGLNMAKQFNANAKEVDNSVFMQGFLNARDSSNLLINLKEKELRAFLNTYFKEKQEKEFEKLKKEGEDFLAINKEKKGVNTTDSGLQYLILKEGIGESPTKSSTVKVHYHGTLIDGTVFDSSVDRGESIDFGVGQVIKGWTEGLQLMKLGAKYKFFIPQELAYGKRDQAKIKPYSTLIFEVELLEIK